MKINEPQLTRLISLMTEHNLSEIELQTKDESIRLKRGGFQSQETALAGPVTPANAKSTATETPDESFIFVTSPFVGTFYRSPSPDADPFVTVGDRIEPGNTLCIVEAMKLMNEIESEVAGKIIEVLVQNGKPVEFGGPALRFRKTEAKGFDAEEGVDRKSRGDRGPHHSNLSRDGDSLGRGS
ncbi:MAG: acetyl-CoA carboxylase biotin carboxyl carrier protein [Polyangiales bacterium]